MTLVRSLVLLSLALAILAAQAFLPPEDEPCACYKSEFRKVQIPFKKIKLCHEQKASLDCDPAYRIMAFGKKWCFNASAPWIKNYIETKKLNCKPLYEYE